MQSSQLEQLERGLHNVLRLAERDEGRAGAALNPDHPAVQAAAACELMLPEILTAATLAEAARHKIDTVQVLLARARAHEKLPPEAQLAADEGYLVDAEDVRQQPGGTPP
ncbi:hypothetical protein [Pseudoduganella buxea]|uniref:Uncharacterized protein n=1 Tax=Pseudoduganella buxea TaxID=1949069 RepID=A0A6I3T1E5_9BURK|nr:hypothetical protein [Pseudoduganella buxea]MTV54302.1 hypothetical protein [Pseudoduganella buxea]GGC12608.1 hypothetical protein GCM10011572_37510 [Pseudoduganella buxea]